MTLTGFNDCSSERMSSLITRDKTVATQVTSHRDSRRGDSEDLGGDGKCQRDSGSNE